MESEQDRSVRWIQRSDVEARAIEERLRKGGGGGTSGGMEERVARLEAHLEHMRDDLAVLRPATERLRALEVRVDHLPSKGFIVTASATTIALLTAAIVFADRLRLLIG